jgi:putative transposase
LKGKSALVIFEKQPEMGEKWNREFWVRGYYVVTVGEANKSAVTAYIAA